MVEVLRQTCWVGVKMLDIVATTDWLTCGWQCEEGEFNANDLQSKFNQVKYALENN